MLSSLELREPIPALLEQPAKAHCPRRLRVGGNFLWCGDDKFFIKGVSYGTFRPNAAGEPFPEPARAAQDFALMQAAGFNTVRTYDRPQRWLLDLAQRHGLRVLAGLPWPQHITIADSRASRRQIAQGIAADVHACGQHPAILAYCVGNEIPSQIVRWYGKWRSEQFLAELCEAVRESDPGGLVTYANFPSTEYLELPFLDFHCFNVYLHDERVFQSYLARLQVLAGSQPICLSEYGLDALAHGEAAQADFLEQQTSAVFRSGFCGSIAFAWTDEWYRGGQDVVGWQFGLTDAARNPRRAYHQLARLLPSMPFGAANRPRISVVVAAFNAAATLADCLHALTRSHYPNFEVIVVDDGSTDRTGTIADEYALVDPRFRVLHEPNHGLSEARNSGISAASGDIVAYTDADCRVDSDWLEYIALKLMNSDVAGVGGPNLVPPDDGVIAQAVGLSPGNPTHIMLSDEIAEHIPGCNMAFWKWVLQDLGGFEPIYTAAGDDVDLCWRLQARGYRIGFAPSALVWHHRRNSLRAYLRQQTGYGRAESLLERAHPEKFNGLGQVRWAGRIYAALPSGRLLSRPRIYQGIFGSAPFQSIYQPSEGLVAYLMQTPEWYALLLGMIVLSVLNPLLFLLPILGVGAQVAVCAHAALTAQLPEPFLAQQEPHLRWLIFWMHFLQPLARAWGRLRGGLGPFRWTRAAATTNGLRESSSGGRRTVGDFTVACWGERDQDKDTFLRALMQQLFNRRCVLDPNTGWDDCDLKIGRGLGTRATLLAVVEYHGGPKVLLRSRVRLHITPFGRALILVSTLLGIYLYNADIRLNLGDRILDAMGIALPVLCYVWLIWERAQLAAQIDSALRITAEGLGMKLIDPQPSVQKMGS